MYLNLNQLSRTVNWHFTSTCNMSCRYCFVPRCKEITLLESYTVLEKLRPYFSRINFVGGEPTCSSKLIPLSKKAKELGYIVSMVTNGYWLYKNNNLRDSILQNFSIIGISVDSLQTDVNKKIGRFVQDEILSKADYINLCKMIKQSGCKLKINTVVSKLNLKEDFNDFYKQVSPDRIKLFQILKPAGLLKYNYDDLLISKSQFKEFVEMHSKYKDTICSEDNELMFNSYFILNGEGCFMDNKTGVLGKSLLSTDVEEALQGVSIDIQKYTKRYA